MSIKSNIKKRVKPLIDLSSYASEAYVELKSHIINQSAELIQFSETSSTPADLVLVEILKGLRVYETKENQLTRIGGANDGGYVMLEPSTPMLAMSLGVGPNVSWDLHMMELGHQVEMFDPTIKTLPTPVLGARFHKVGVVGNFKESNFDLRTLRDLRFLCDSKHINSTLKIDVEGAEWAAFAGTPVDELENYEQIAVEFHDLHDLVDEKKSKLCLSAISNINKTHFAVHLHANNYSKLIRFGSYWFPDAIEVTFVRKSTHLQGSLVSKVRSVLDSPNAPMLPEYDLESLITLWKWDC
jgi:hypothetical protein